MAIASASYFQPSVPARFQQARQGLLALKTTVQQPATTEAVTFEARYASRVKFVSEPTYSTRTVYENRDTYGDRDVTGERNVYETRPVYTDRPVYETRVTGTRDLRGFNSAIAAGLDEKADFSVQVGSAAAAVVKFHATSIDVIANGTTRTLSYGTGAGEFQTTLTTAIGSIEGLDASLDANGKLVLTTDNAQSLTLAEVPNEFLNVSGTALDKLGLTAGTTSRQQTGTVSEQTGTQQVQTGTETVVVGRERYKVGSERVATGTESYVSGSQMIENGTENALVGYDRVVSRTEKSRLDEQTRQVSARQTLVQLIKAAQKDLGGSGALGQSVVEGISSVISLLGGDAALTGDKIDTAVKRLDQARGAYLTAAGVGQVSVGSSLSRSA